MSCYSALFWSVNHWRLCRTDLRFPRQLVLNRPIPKEENHNRNHITQIKYRSKSQGH
jgi:hypothetical protein